MAGKIDQRVEYCNSQKCSDRQVRNVFFEDIPFDNKRFECKGQKHNYGNNPSPKGKADG